MGSHFSLGTLSAAKQESQKLPVMRPQSTHARVRVLGVPHARAWSTATGVLMSHGAPSGGCGEVGVPWAVRLRGVLGPGSGLRALGGEVELIRSEGDGGAREVG